MSRKQWTKLLGRRALVALGAGGAASAASWLPSSQAWLRSECWLWERDWPLHLAGRCFLPWRRAPFFAPAQSFLRACS